MAGCLLCAKRQLELVVHLPSIPSQYLYSLITHDVLIKCLRDRYEAENGNKGSLDRDSNMLRHKIIDGALPVLWAPLSEFGSLLKVLV